VDRLAAARRNIGQVEEWLRGKYLIYNDTSVGKEYRSAIIVLRDASDLLKTEQESRRLAKAE